MDLIDTHCHLTFKPLDVDIEGVLERSKAAGVTSWITVGTSLEDSQKAVRFADRFDNLYATVGAHPHDAKDFTADTLTELGRLAQNVNVVAIGETGLDFHYNFSKQPDQLRVFA
ncbi:MAG: TatD family hydrolase, partial [Sedimentisphaerales bacterium]|nr:TatD family hydrolase [Sedimentisphaerales bacterium]